MQLVCAGQMVEAEIGNFPAEAPPALAVVEAPEVVSEKPELNDNDGKGWKTYFDACACFVACIVILFFSCTPAFSTGDETRNEECPEENNGGQLLSF